MSLPDPEAVSFEQTHRRKQRLLAGAGALAVLLPATWLTLDTLEARAVKDAARLTPPQQAELAALLDAREAAARQSVTDWNALARADAVAALAVTDAGCKAELVPPPQVSAAVYVRFATHDVAFGRWTLCVLRDAGSCDATFAADPAVALLRTRLAEADTFTWDLEAVKAQTTPEPERVLVVPTAETPPDVHSTLRQVGFTPGTLAGRAFVFVPADRRFVCAGEVAVRNSKTVDIEYPHFDEGPEEQRKVAEAETRAALARDLEMHLRYAVPKAVRAVAP